MTATAGDGGMADSGGHVPKEEFVGSGEPPIRNQAQPKGKKREIHTRITEDDHKFLVEVFGVGYMSHGIRTMLGSFRKTKGNPIEVLQKKEEMHLQEAALCHEQRLELEAQLAQKEKEEQELNAKREEVLNMLVNASRRHAKVNLMLWQTATERSGISIPELKKIVKEKLKESELNEN